MKNFVFVSHNLNNTIRIVKRLQEDFSKSNPDNPVIKCKILLFCSSLEDAELEISLNTKNISPFDLSNLVIEPITLWDFDEKVDEVLSEESNTDMVIVDFILEEDGSDGVPERMVNIRYFKKQPDKKKNKIFFYTLTGTENYDVLCNLVGSLHVVQHGYDNNHFSYLNLSKLLL